MCVRLTNLCPRVSRRSACVCVCLPFLFMSGVSEHSRPNVQSFITLPWSHDEKKPLCFWGGECLGISLITINWHGMESGCLWWTICSGQAVFWNIQNTFVCVRIVILFSWKESIICILSYKNKCIWVNRAKIKWVKKWDWSNERHKESFHCLILEVELDSQRTFI